MAIAPATTLNPLEPQLPPGKTLLFGTAAPPKEIVAVVQAYITPEGNLLPYSVVEGQPGSLVVTRSSGFAYLDNQAREAIKALLKQQPPKGEGYRSIKYQVPFKLPQQAQG
jgi:TonB family protein